MNNIVLFALFGTLVGVLGTGIGGVLAVSTDRCGSRFLAAALEFSAGLMLAVVLMDLLPHAMENATIWLLLPALFLGMWFMFLAERYVEIRQKKQKKLPKTQQDLLRMGIAMAIGLAMHNLPEGLALGSGFDASIKLGTSLSMVILLHNIPEGLAMVAPLRLGGMKTGKAITIAAASGLPTGIGALIGAALGQVSEQMISFCLAMAAGTMIFVVLTDLIPQSKKMYGGRIGSLFNMAGLILGIILSTGMG